MEKKYNGVIIKNLYYPIASKYNNTILIYCNKIILKRLIKLFSMFFYCLLKVSINLFFGIYTYIIYIYINYFMT